MSMRRKAASYVVELGSRRDLKIKDVGELATA
jgi:hypothetical protein